MMKNNRYSLAFMLILCISLVISSLSVSAAPLPTIVSIKDITIELYQGKTYAFPKSVDAIMSDKSIKQMPVKWNNMKLDMNRLGKYTYLGTVNGYKNKAKLTINVKATPKINLSLYSPKQTLYVGETMDVKVIIEPTAVIKTTPSFSSDNISVVSIDEKGRIKALNPGEVTVSAKVEDRISFTKLKVLSNIQSVNVETLAVALYPGQNFKINPIVKMNNSIQPKINYKSSAPQIAAVDEQGMVVGVEKGTAVITIAAEDKQVNISVDVNPPPVLMKLIPRDYNVVKKVSENLTFRTGVNTDFLYIAASTGGNFDILPSYLGEPDQYGFNKKAKEYFKAYTRSQNAKYIYETAMAINNPPRKFISNMLHDVLRYDENALYNKSYQAEALINILELFQAETNAEQFFKENQGIYQSVMEDFNSKVDFDYIQRLEDFFGERPAKSSFQVVLSTVMNGGQATKQELEDGSMNYYIIMNPGRDEQALLHNLYHETVHNFYNVRQRRADMVSSHAKYSSVLGNTQYNFADQVNETITQAVTAVLLEQYHDEKKAQEDLMRFEQNGEKGVYNIYRLIKNKYVPNRSEYKTFDEFVPVIFEYIKATSLNQNFDVGEK